MRKLTVFALLLILLATAGVAMAHPTGDQPNTGVFSAVCDGIGDVDVVITGQAGHTSLGPMSIARTIYANGQLVYENPGQGYQTVWCTWTLPEVPGVIFTGEIQIAPPR